MVANVGSQACIDCAKSRRKCGRQSPQCLRCETRGRPCRYPPSKPTAFVAITDGTAPEFTELILPNIISPFNLHLSLPTDASHWFAAPQTWTIDGPTPQQLVATRFNSDDFDHILGKVLGWLIEWVDTGSNPFIHRHLYQSCFPPAIQDAYIALSAYLHRSPMNEGIVKRIVVEKAEKLVQEGLIVNEERQASATDVLDNLSSVQALLIYQTIGFYDSDIRLRHLANAHIPVLESWVSILMKQASSIIPTFSPPPTHSSENVLWYSWILAESVRRIWLVVGGLQGLYKFFTNPDPSKPCMGGTIFTSRRGFWEAPSASVWEKECTERYAGLVRLTETEKMFAMVPREEICEFAKVVLQCTFGMQWCKEKLDAGL